MVNGGWFTLPPNMAEQAVEGRRPAEAPASASAAPAKRPYTRQRPRNACAKCRQELSAETGHRRGKAGPSRNKVYCPAANEGVTYDEWLGRF